MDKTIYIIRHGETAYNKMMIMQGRSINLSLNETGREQTQKFFQKYQIIPFDLVISSELKRSKESIVDFVKKGIPHIIDERITEISWGINEGQPIDKAVKNRYKVMIEEWAKGNLDYSIPRGESGRSLYNRMRSFVNWLKQRNENTILISTHGRALKMLVNRLLDEPISKMEEYPHANTGLYLFKQKGQIFELIKLNDTSHL